MTDELHADRRSFLRTGAIAGTALVAGASGAIAQIADTDAWHRPLTKGDIDILTFLAVAEILESDLWEQYNELGGIQDSEEPAGSGSPAYTAALKNLDGDMDQYIHDNTDDEKSHRNFINAYLISKGVAAVNLDAFRTLQGSQATGAVKTKKNGSPISRSSKSIPVGGHGIAPASITPILTRRLCFRRRFQACSLGTFRQSHGPTPT